MHRLLRVSYCALGVLMLLLGACGPKPASPTSPPVANQPEVAAPVATEPPTAAAVAVRAAPEMAVGSTFRYFDGCLLVAVPGGQFTMGSGGQDNPIHTVNVSDFWICSTETTNRMYKLCVDLGQCTPPDGDDNPDFTDLRQANKPVVGVNWQQASAYCGFVHGRLPTEAEWEKTARGIDARTFPWGNEPPTCNLLNFDGCLHETTSVGRYDTGMSYYKAWDMSGNVFEWISDIYDAKYYGAAPTQDPTGPMTGTRRSVRSSAFNSDGFLTEVARRFYAKPEEHRIDLGFRCVIDDPTYYAPLCTVLVAYGKLVPGGPGAGQNLGELCNTPTIEQLQRDCNNTNVWIDCNGDCDPSVPSGCDDLGMQLHGSELQHLYSCHTAGLPIKVCGSCTYPLPSETSCPSGYHQEGSSCVLDAGAPGECPVGTTYDPTLMCCSVTPGAEKPYDICASGYSPAPGPSGGTACVNYVAGDIICAGDVVKMKEGCGGHHGQCPAGSLDEDCSGSPCPPDNPYCDQSDCGPNNPYCD